MRSNLFLGQRTLDEWKAACRSSHRAHYQRLLKQAASYHDWLPPAEHPRKSITFVGMAAANLALAYALSGQAEFLGTLQKWLAVAIGYSHWGRERLPDRDLDAAWLLFGLSLAYAWVGDSLPVEERTALRDKLRLQGQKLYDYSLETDGRWWSSAYWQNHNWICYTGLAAAAYALSDEYPDTKNWSQRALDNFKVVFEALPEDGSDYEGVVYWCYGVTWLMIYADLAARQEGVDFYSTPFLQNTFYFRLYMSGPNLVDTANFGDCHDRRSAHARAMYYWFARQYGNGHAQWLAEHFEQIGEWDRESREGMLLPGLLPQAFLDLLWYDPTVQPAPVADLPLARLFPDLGLATIRTSWEPDALFLAFKSSVPLGRKAWGMAHDLLQNRDWDAVSGGHLHPDENSFILIRGADYLAVDEGNCKAKQSIHHSTILVDGRGQYNEGVYHVAKGLTPDWGAQLEDAWAADGLLYARGEAAGAYSSELGLIRFNRQVLVWDENLVLLYDDLAADQPRQFEWLLQTDARAAIKAANHYVVLTGESRLGVNFISPDGMVARTIEQEIVAVPTSAEPDNVLRRAQHTLSISPRNHQQAARFLAVFMVEGREGEPARVERLDCANGLGARIRPIGREILAGFAGDGRYLSSADCFGTDAPWLVSESKPNGQITRLAVGDCTRTYLDNQLWCAASSPASFIFREDGWQVQSPGSTWVNLRVPAQAAAVFGDRVFESRSTSQMIRLAVSGGISKILLQMN